MKFRFLIVFIAFGFSAFSQPNLNLELLSNVEVGEAGNDIWGYVDNNGTEYAVMGSQTATRIFSLEDKANPIERAVISGASSIWRDIKSYDQYLYVTTDQGNDGLLIIDMSEAPDVIEHKFWNPVLDVGDGNPETITKCHNLFVDAEDGWCYLAGCNPGVGGVIILDIHTDPLNPIYVGATNEYYSHDVVTRGDTIYSSEISDGHFSVYVAEDKANPVRTILQATTSNFTHNAWPSDDGKFLFTTDERPNAFVDSYDISDPNNVQLLDAFQPAETAGNGVIPHNTHYDAGYLVTSWYTDGVVIIDANEPDNLVKVGAYDTWLGPDGGFSGCWGVYPYLPSGTIIASDINSGLYVFSSTVERACYLEGNVIDKDSGLPITMARVEIDADQIAIENTNAAGEFKTGLATAGTYTAIATRIGYMPAEVEVILENGLITDVTIEMQQLPTVQFIGNVVKNADGSAIEGAQVIAISETQEIIAASQADGTFTMTLFEEDYQIYAGAWGYNEAEIANFDPLTATGIEMRLNTGYKDDFVVDQGWTVSGDAETGIWVREEPIGTNIGGGFANPEFDSDTDEFGDIAYITGNAGGGAGTDDVDSGTTTLTSKPMDLTGMVAPTLSFVKWFYNGGGQGSDPDDALTVILADGVNTVEVAVYDNSLPAWIPELVAIDITTLDPSNITVAFETSDFDSSGHLVEAGIDQFAIVETSSNKDLVSLEATLSPMPFNEFLQVSVQDENITNYNITDVHGKILMKGKINESETTINTANLNSGVYFIQLRSNDQQGIAKKIIKH